MTDLLTTAPYPLPTLDKTIGPEEENGNVDATVIPMPLPEGKIFEDASPSSNGQPLDGNAKTAESVIFRLLVEADSIAYLSETHFPTFLLPTDELRLCYLWALRQYEDSGEPPTVLMFKQSKATGHPGTSWADLLAEYNIDIEDLPDEPISWAVKKLQSHHLFRKTLTMLKQAGTDIAKASDDDRLAVFLEHLDEWNDFAETLGGDGVMLGHEWASDTIWEIQEWLWEDKVALGTLNLLIGHGGLGKSTLAVTVAAQITQGTLPGAFLGTPRNTVYVGSEDRWENVVVQRFTAAGGDLSKVAKVFVKSGDNGEPLLLPTHVRQIESKLVELDAALLVFDPILGYISPDFHTHIGAEVRQALGPMIRTAEEVGCTIWGIIHENKSGSKHAATATMASIDFTNMARGTLMVCPSPEDENVILLGQPKNNYAAQNTPCLRYSIEGIVVTGPGKDGPIDCPTSRIVWQGEDNRSINAVREAAAKAGQGTASDNALDCVIAYLRDHGGAAPGAEVLAEAIDDGHASATVRRAVANTDLIEKLPIPGSNGGGKQWVLTLDPV